MNNKELEIAFAKEYEDVKAPANLKASVSKSIDSLLLLRSLLNFYASLPLTIIKGITKTNIK